MAKYWWIVISCVGLFGYILNTIIFFPGYMSRDTVTQLGQVLGVYPLTDMQPLAMVAIWRLLIEVSGATSSMLIMQLMMLWLALTLFAVFIFKRTKSVGLSLSPFTIAILPFVINISGVIWKDNQMTFALLLAVAGCLFFKYISSKWVKICLLVVVLLLIVYACLVRYNALPAILPITYLAIKQSGFFSRLKWQITMVVATCIAIPMIYSFLGAAMHAHQSNPSVFVMIDDISNTGSNELLGRANMSDDIKQEIRSIQVCAKQKEQLINNYWVCASDTQRALLSGSHYRDIKTYWINTIASKPIEYILFKVNSYVLFLFPPAGVYYVWQDGIEPNEFNKQVRHRNLNSIVESYVNNFGYKHFSYMYEPWFWLAISVTLVYYLRKKSNLFPIADFWRYHLSSILQVFFLQAPLLTTALSIGQLLHA